MSTLIQVSWTDAIDLAKITKANASMLASFPTEIKWVFDEFDQRIKEIEDSGGDSEVRASLITSKLALANDIKGEIDKSDRSKENVWLALSDKISFVLEMIQNWETQRYAKLLTPSNPYNQIVAWYIYRIAFDVASKQNKFKASALKDDLIDKLQYILIHLSKEQSLNTDSQKEIYTIASYFARDIANEIVRNSTIESIVGAYTNIITKINPGIRRIKQSMKDDIDNNIKLSPHDLASKSIDREVLFAMIPKEQKPYLDLKIKSILLWINDSSVNRLGSSEDQNNQEILD